MATTDELRDRADWMLDGDPLKVLAALDSVLSYCDRELAEAPVFANAIKKRIGSALGIQEGGGGDA
jgi:hypothetical protein